MRRVLTASAVVLITLLLAGAYVVQGQIVVTDTVNGSGGRYGSDLGRSWATFGTKTDTSNLSLQGAPGANTRVFLYEAYCVNSSASTAGVALIKYSTTTVASVNCQPASKDVTPLFFDPPLPFPANTAVTMNSVGSVSTMYLFASGTVAR